MEMPRHQEKEEKDASQKEENLPNLLAASFFLKYAWPMQTCLGLQKPWLCRTKHVKHV